ARVTDAIRVGVGAGRGRRGGGRRGRARGAGRGRLGRGGRDSRRGGRGGGGGRRRGRRGGGRGGARRGGARRRGGAGGGRGGGGGVGRGRARRGGARRRDDSLRDGEGVEGVVILVDRVHGERRVERKADGSVVEPRKAAPRCARCAGASVREPVTVGAATEQRLAEGPTGIDCGFAVERGADAARHDGRGAEPVLARR